MVSWGIGSSPAVGKLDNFSTDCLVEVTRKIAIMSGIHTVDDTRTLPTFLTLVEATRKLPSYMAFIDDSRNIALLPDTSGGQ